MSVLAVTSTTVAAAATSHAVHVPTAVVVVVLALFVLWVVVRRKAHLVALLALCVLILSLETRPVSSSTTRAMAAPSSSSILIRSSCAGLSPQRATWAVMMLSDADQGFPVSTQLMRCTRGLVPGGFSIQLASSQDLSSVSGSTSSPGSTPGPELFLVGVAFACLLLVLLAAILGLLLTR